MNWDNLKNRKCPRCTSKLESSTPFAEEFRCSEPHCMFKIKEQRFTEIVSNLYKKEDRMTLHDNLEDLNNLVI